MANTVYKYSLFCVTESAWKFVWAAEGDPVPDKCPTNSAHEINSGSIHISDIVKETEVEVKEENERTQGHYQADGFQMDVSAAVGWTALDVSYPFPISLMCGGYAMGTANIGDRVKAIAAPDTIIGAISADVAIGANKFKSAAETLGHMQIGYCIKLSDGTNEDDCGRILAIDLVNLEVTFETVTTHAFAAATPTYLKMTVEVVREIKISVNNPSIEFGKRNLKSTYFPANTVLRFAYYNTDGLAKTVNFFMEFFY